MTERRYTYKVQQDPSKTTVTWMYVLKLDGHPFVARSGFKTAKEAATEAKEICDGGR